MRRKVAKPEKKHNPDGADFYMKRAERFNHKILAPVSTYQEQSCTLPGVWDSDLNGGFLLRRF
jgi:hypothetical protein